MSVNTVPAALLVALPSDSANAAQPCPSPEQSTTPIANKLKRRANLLTRFTHLEQSLLRDRVLDCVADRLLAALSRST